MKSQQERKASQGSPADFFVQHGGWISSPSKKPAPQSHMAFNTEMMLCPNGVREYSVLGGLCWHGIAAQALFAVQPTSDACHSTFSCLLRLV